MKNNSFNNLKIFGFNRVFFSLLVFVFALSFSATSCIAPEGTATNNEIDDPNGNGNKNGGGDDNDTGASIAEIKDLLPKGYYMEWHPGIPGGIPKVTTKSGSTITPNGTNDMTGTINSAIQTAGNNASAENRLYVELGAGTFTVNGTILLNKSNVVLRGQGKSTVIQGINKGGGAIVFGAEWDGSGNTWSGSSVNVTANVWAGASSITVADASGFSAGDILILDREADDNGDPRGAAGAGASWRSDQVGGGEWRNSQQYDIRGPGTNGGPSTTTWRPVKQYIEISSISGNTLNLANKINIDFPVSLNPQVYKTRANLFQYIGLENMKLEIVSGGNSPEDQWEYNPPAVKMSMASSYCWVKNVESDGSKTRTISVGTRGFKARHITMWGLRNVVTGCYVHDSYDNRPGGNGYGIEIHGTDGLIENNISDFLCKPILGYASGGGNVIAYNYVPNTETGHSNGGAKIIDWLETAIDTSHASYSHSDLYEGNYAANISTDNTSGNNGQMVIFRNHGFGRNLKPGKMNVTTNLMAFSVAGWNNEHASIGNVWLSAGYANNTVVMQSPQNNNGSQNIPAVYKIGTYAWNRTSGGGSGANAYDTGSGIPAEGWAMSKFFRHLDFNPIDNKVYKNPESSAETLPKSFYRSSAPDYFGGYTWPPVDPFGTSDSARIPGLPAKTRYESGGWL